MKHRLRIPRKLLHSYSQRYNQGLDPTLTHLELAVQEQGHLTRQQVHELALWKSRRRANLVKVNDETFVREITAFAFSTTHEHARIGALSLLQGVKYPTASVILHFCLDRSYPILDFRAIWSLGMEQPSSYTPNYWVEYTDLCRSIATTNELSVRELDMALWQYSKEHQGNA